MYVHLLQQCEFRALRKYIEWHQRCSFVGRAGFTVPEEISLSIKPVGRKEN